MRGRRTDAVKQSGPSPNSYLPNISVSSESQNRANAQFSFGTADRFKSPRHISPGPAAYTPPMAGENRGSARPALGKALRASMDPKMDTPGPGAYTPREHHPVGKTMAFRLLKESSTVSPGPAAYAPEVDADRRGPSWGFGGAQRDVKMGGSVAPGPGAYELKRDLQGPACSLTPRRDNVFDLL